MGRGEGYFVVSTQRWPDCVNTLLLSLTFLFGRVEEYPLRHSTALLLLSHQLHNETRDMIRKLPTKSYVLDVIIANETKLWATWLYAPVLSTRVDRVYAAIRTIGHYTEGPWILQGGDGGPPQLTWALYSLIERGLKAGPVGRRIRKMDRRISIKELVIDVRTPNVPPSKIYPKGLNRGRKREDFREKHGPEFILNPDYVLGYIRSDIDLLLKMCYHTAEFGGLLYERIGRTKVLMDGQLREEWDLAQELVDLQFSDSFGRFPRERREEIFNTWKQSAFQTRKDLDLPVILPTEGGEEHNRGHE